jgi:hypothetical protein
MIERQALLNVARELLETTDRSAEELATAFRREGRGRGSFPCDWCPWESECLGSVPEVPVVPVSQEEAEAAEVAAVEYMAARLLRDEATERLERARTALLGVGGTFGGWRVGWGAASEKAVPDAKSMQARLEELGEPVPMVTQRRAGAIRVGRVRG